MLIFEIFVASILLWIMFIAVCNFRAHLTHDHNILIETGIQVFSIIFLIFDVAFNLVYGSIVFMDRPREWTLTSRLKRYLRDESIHSTRYKMASFFCRKMIEPWDWNHCGLRDA